LTLVAFEQDACDHPGKLINAYFMQINIIMFYLNQLSRELRNAHYFRATNLYNLKIITLFAHILPCTTPVVFHTISCSRLVWRRRWMFQML